MNETLKYKEIDKVCCMLAMVCFILSFTFLCLSIVTGLRILFIMWFEAMGATMIMMIFPLLIRMLAGKTIFKNNQLKEKKGIKN